jgi:hypothetical protein
VAGSSEIHKNQAQSNQPEKRARAACRPVQISIIHSACRWEKRVRRRGPWSVVRGPKRSESSPSPSPSSNSSQVPVQIRSNSKKATSRVPPCLLGASWRFGDEGGRRLAASRPSVRLRVFRAPRGAAVPGSCFAWQRQPNNDLYFRTAGCLYFFFCREGLQMVPHECGRRIDEK